jgi:hypothetical protein
MCEVGPGTQPKKTHYKNKFSLKYPLQANENQMITDNKK